MNDTEYCMSVEYVKKYKKYSSSAFIIDHTQCVLVVDMNAITCRRYIIFQVGKIFSDKSLGRNGLKRHDSRFGRLALH